MTRLWLQQRLDTLWKRRVGYRAAAELSATVENFSGPLYRLTGKRDATADLITSKAKRKIL